MDTKTYGGVTAKDIAIFIYWLPDAIQELFHLL